MVFSFGQRRGDGAFPELMDGRKVHHVTAPIGVGVLDGGMVSGNVSVALKLDLPDGSSVLVETSAKLFVQAAAYIKVRSQAWRKPITNDDLVVVDETTSAAQRRWHLSQEGQTE
jgi:hypothetical protein